jgi:5-hydroxyisourate hydrolase
MISTHILDTNLGCPASKVKVKLERQVLDASWELIDSGITNEDGRSSFKVAAANKLPGVYRLTFEVADYFKAQSLAPFFHSVPVIFMISDLERSYHIPLLLNRFGYSTYRGS